MAPQMTKPGHKIDYFLKNFEALSMTLSGEPKQRIEADYMQHFVDDDSTEMTRPIMTMYSPNKPDLHIRSDTGYISSDGELILLVSQGVQGRDKEGVNFSFSPIFFLLKLQE